MNLSAKILFGTHELVSVKKSSAITRGSENESKQDQIGIILIEQGKEVFPSET